jgi:nucleoside 2-deoxyribosyltransferase
MKSSDLALELVHRMERLGFRVLCPVINTPQNLEAADMFKANISLIRECDLFVAVLKEYGKDLAAETGMAYAWGKGMIGLDYGADPRDIMVFCAYDKIIEPIQLEETLTRYLD